MKWAYLIIYPCCLVIGKILVRESNLEARLLFSYIIYILSLFSMLLGFFILFRKNNNIYGFLWILISIVSILVAEMDL